MKCVVARRAKMQATYVEGESLEDYNARLRANAEEVEAPPEALDSLNIGCVTVLNGDMYARTLDELTGE